MSSLAPLRLPHLDPSRTGDASEDLRRVEDWLNTVLPRALQSWGAASEIGTQEESASAVSSDSGGGGGGGGSNVEPGTADGQLLRWDDTSQLWEPAPGAIIDSDGRLTITGDTPQVAIGPEVNGDGQFQAEGFDPSPNVGLVTRVANGTKDAPTAVGHDAPLMRLFASGRGATDWNNEVAKIEVRALQDFTDVIGSTYILLYTAPVGTKTAVQALRIENTGITAAGKVLAILGLGAPITAASALGALTGVHEAFDETGASMGWVPVYASFTP